MFGLVVTVGSLAVIIAWLVGGILVAGLTIAIMGAILEPVLTPLLTTYGHTGRSTGRHAYNRAMAVSEGIRKAGRSYRLTPDGWREVTA